MSPLKQIKKGGIILIFNKDFQNVVNRETYMWWIPLLHLHSGLAALKQRQKSNN